MSDSKTMSKTRKSTVINQISKNQEKEINQALLKVKVKLKEKFPNVSINDFKRLYLKDIVKRLNESFSNMKFNCKFKTTFITPDGGFLYISDKQGKRFPILISEVKNQGTNDMRLKEGKKKQAQGNAIERLGKNLIGLRTYFLNEDIFPFICFGYGCDFADDSSIVDRVVTMAMFGQLNKINLRNEGCFNRGSFYFRKDKWSVDEMAKVMYQIAEQSINYYFEKYGKETFK